MLKHMNDNHKNKTLDATFFNPSFADSERNSIEGEVVMLKSAWQSKNPVETKRGSVI